MGGGLAVEHLPTECESISGTAHTGKKGKKGGGGEDGSRGKGKEEGWLGGRRGEGGGKKTEKSGWGGERKGSEGLEGEMNSKCGGKRSEGAGIQRKDGVQGQLQPNEMIRGQTAVLGPTCPRAAEATFLNPLCIQIKI